LEKIFQKTEGGIFFDSRCIPRDTQTGFNSMQCVCPLSVCPSYAFDFLEAGKS